MIADVQVAEVESKRGDAAQVPLNRHQNVRQYGPAVPLCAASAIHVCPPVTPFVQVALANDWQTAMHKSPAAIEATGVSVIVAVALVADTPSAGSEVEPK
jgi:hypothetical protein